MKKILYWPILTILFFTILISVTNFKPGLFFSGWDNLHPEFQPLSYFIDKSLFGVWHESYGLGGIIANAPYTEIFRVPFYFILSIFVGEINVRFFWTLLMLSVGGLGFFYFSKKYFTEKIWLATVVSIFYMVNLGTVQNFFTPNESFSHFFASLPWLLLVFFNFIKLEGNSKKLALDLIIVNLLATPSFYITPIFIVYFLILSIVSISFVLSKKNFLIHLKKIFLGGLLIFIANVYWLIPYQHFVFTGKSNEVSESRTYNINTQDSILRNNFSTNIWKTLQLQGLWFETTDKINGTNTLIMESWVDYYQNQFIKYISFIPVILVFAGVIFTIFTIKNDNRRSILFLFILSLISLGSTNPPFGFFVTLIQENIPILKDIFRFSFTKFIVVYSLTYSLLILICLDKVSSFIKNQKYQINLFISFLFVTLILSVPVFTGNFFYQKLGVYFPKEYEEVAEIINSKKSQDRVLYVPNSPSIGWTYFDWGYRGSGFLWYFLNSNVLDEAFEIHSKYNSQAIRLSKEAFYEGNTSKLSELMSDYNIRFLLFDKSIQTCGVDCIRHFEKNFEKIKTSQDFRILFNKGSLVLLEHIEVNKKIFKSRVLSDSEILNSSNSLLVKKFNKDATVRISSPYKKGNFNFYNLQRENNSIFISPVLPKVKISDNETLDSTLGFNFSEKVCDGCGDVVIDNGVENIHFSNNNTKKSFGFVNSGNPLIVYGGNGTVLENIKLFNITKSLQFCSNIEFAKQASIGWQELKDRDGLRIESRGISPCFSYKSESDFENLTLFNLNYESDKDFYLEIAFINEFGQKELKFFSLRSGKSNEKLMIKLPTRVSKPEIFFVIRPYSSGKEINLSIKDIKIESSFPKINEFSVPNKDDTFLKVFESSELSIDYSESQKLSNYTINPDSYFVNNYKLCEEKNKEEIPEKRVNIEKSGTKFFKYESDKGTTCETFELASLFNTAPYLLKVNSENIVGNRLKACIQNTFQNYCLLERNLFSRNEKFIFNKFSQNENKILQLNLINNFVTENDKRENLIQSVDFDFIPVSWLEDISFSNDQELLSLKRISPFLYYGTINKSGLVTNFQSKDSGWVGFCITGNCYTQKYSDKTWNNVWKVEFSSNDSIFVAVFLPQLYLFFGLFLVIFIALILKFLNRSS